MVQEIAAEHLVVDRQMVAPVHQSRPARPVDIDRITGPKHGERGAEGHDVVTSNRQTGIAQRVAEADESVDDRGGRVVCSDRALSHRR